MSDAITEARDAARRRERKERREDIIQIGFQLTEARAQREEISLKIQELEDRLTELLKDSR